MAQDKTTKESAIYLHFFSANKLNLILPALIFGLAFFYLDQKLPSSFWQSQVFEINFQKESLNQSVTLTEEAVGLLRNQSFQAEIGLGKDDHLRAYQSGPISLSLNIDSSNQEQTSVLMNKTASYLQQKYGLWPRGKRLSQVRKIPLPLLLFFGSLLGFSLGLFFSLLKSYFRHY